MSLRIIGRRLSHIGSIAATTDRVVVQYPLPKGCTLRRVFLECHVLGPATLTLTQTVLYGVSGFVVPILDPDTPDSVDDIWDIMVPKDVANAAGVFDLDQVTADVGAEFELGEPDLTGIFGVANNEPIEIFRRRKMITVANNPTGFTRQDGAADTWLATDFFSTTIKRRVMAARHSYVLIGFSAPGTANTDAAVKQTITESEWVMMTYLETFIENAIMNLMGLVETGAETPYVESAAFVAELIEDTMEEDTAGAFVAAPWNVFTRATFEVEVPGRFMTGGVLTSE